MLSLSEFSPSPFSYCRSNRLAKLALCSNCQPSSVRKSAKSIARWTTRRENVLRAQHRPAITSLSKVSRSYLLCLASYRATVYCKGALSNRHYQNWVMADVKTLAEFFAASGCSSTKLSEKMLRFTCRGSIKHTWPLKFARVVTCRWWKKPSLVEHG